MFTQQRRTKRIDTKVNAQIKIGNAIFDGEVLDYSALGLFFTPKVSYVDGYIINGEDALDGLEQNAKCEVTLLGPGNRPTIIFVVKSRWIGKSDHHGCFGVGFENIAQENTQDVKLAA